MVNVINMGAPRSGTNYLTDLVHANYKVNMRTEREFDVWKHGRFVEPRGGWDKIDCVLISIKTLPAWLISAYSWTLRGGRAIANTSNFPTFIRRKFDVSNLAVGARRSDYPGWQHTVTEFENPCKYWNFINSYYIKTPIPVKKYIIDYNSLLANPVKTLHMIERQRLESPWIDIEKQSGPTCFTDLGLFAKRDFYIKEKYLNQYCQEDLDWVLEQQQLIFQ